MPDSTCSVETCKRSPKSRGLCSSHYMDWWRAAPSTEIRKRLPTEARFWANVVRGPGCWEWAGDRWPNGYGRLSVNGRGMGAHRFSWVLANGGPIPAGLVICHDCDNPPCVRPDHLFLGTYADNTADKFAKGRANSTHSGRGKKLTWAVVDQIRAERDAGVPQVDIAGRFSISQAQVSMIVHNKLWDPAKRRPQDP